MIRRVVSHLGTPLIGTDKTVRWARDAGRRSSTRRERSRVVPLPAVSPSCCAANVSRFSKPPSSDSSQRARPSPLHTSSRPSRKFHSFTAHQHVLVCRQLTLSKLVQSTQKNVKVNTSHALHSLHSYARDMQRVSPRTFFHEYMYARHVFHSQHTNTCNAISKIRVLTANTAQTRVNTAPKLTL